MFVKWREESVREVEKGKTKRVNQVFTFSPLKLKHCWGTKNVCSLIEGKATYVIEINIKLFWNHYW